MLYYKKVINLYANFLKFARKEKEWKKERKPKPYLDLPVRPRSESESEVKWKWKWKWIERPKTFFKSAANF